MDRFLRLNLPFLRCRNYRDVLALMWCAGLLLGISLSYSADAMLVPVVSAATSDEASFISLLSVLLLPFILSFLAGYLLKIWLLIPIVFIKSFLFSFVAAGFVVTYGSAAWLLCGLVMFADLLALPLLWWFWLQAGSEDKQWVLRSGVATGCGIILISCFDFYTVAPFLASLLL